MPRLRRALVLAVLLVCSAFTKASADSPPLFIGYWGSLGSGPGFFDHPFGVATDALGNVYVTDQHNFRVEQFKSDGTFIRQFPTGFDTYPTGITVGSFGRLYVVMNHIHAVYIYSSVGIFLGQIGTPGSAPGQFFFPVAVATDAAGDVYIADYGNYRVDKFTAGGAYLFSWSTLGGPYGIAVDPSGFIYVGEWGLDRVEKFDSAGNLITSWGTTGTGDGQFNGPEGIVADNDGHVYVCDTGNNRVQKFTSAGAYLTQWGTLGYAANQFFTPSDIAIDGFGVLFVAEWNNFRIQKFTNDPVTPVHPMSWGQLKAVYR